ncbi:MAG: pyridoxal phosphate-dependent aminotransferase [Elusimicrobia bacterium]|nr:pyridoxal phosphate-dependent aminotransferase [Elusimicrobiota bacterium]
MKLSKLMTRLGTESAFEMLAKAKALEAQGKNIVHLEIGEPDFNTPSNICERGKKAIDEGWTHYCPASGIKEARAAVAEYVAKTRSIKAAPEQVVLTPGAKPAIVFTILALADPGDEVIIPNPTYPIYESATYFAGAKPVPLALREEKGFDLDLKELEAALNGRTKLIVINSPANPTGGVMAEKTFDKIAAMLKKFPDVMVLSDEIYSRIVYEGKHRSIAEWPGMRDRTIIIDGMSKTYAMTGWRLGYAVAPVELAKAMDKLAINMHSCTASMVQIAGIEAISGPQGDVDKMVAEFRRRREVIIKGLTSIPGFTCIRPRAAFYAFPNVKALGLKAKELAEFILYEANVSCLGGTAFGNFGEGYLRFSYANSVENIDEAVRRIKEALPRLKAKPQAAARKG